MEKCLQILLDSNRIPEAAFFARTYLPSEISRIVELWREQLSKVNERAGQSLADPKVIYEPEAKSLFQSQSQSKSNPRGKGEFGLWAVTTTFKA